MRRQNGLLAIGRIAAWRVGPAAACVGYQHLTDFHRLAGVIDAGEIGVAAMADFAGIDNAQREFAANADQLFVLERMTAIALNLAQPIQDAAKFGRADDEQFGKDQSVIADGVAEGLHTRQIAFGPAYGLDAASMFLDMGADHFTQFQPLLLDRHRCLQATMQL